MTDHGRSMRERMLAGELDLANDPELVADLERAQRLAHRYNAMEPGDREARRALLRELLGSFGEGSEIRAPFHCDYGRHTTVGARTFINIGVVCLDGAGVAIGDDVQIGPNVQLLTATHPLEPRPRREKWESAFPISVGDNAWIGGGAIVLPGVSIGPDSVVGAGSVVTRDVPARSVVVGNPARVVRTLAED
jgi:maltose O-acetyltransferase